MPRVIAIFLLLLVCQLAAVFAPVRAIWAIVTGNPDRAFDVVKGYDLLGNTIVNGVAGEYISTRANRARSEGRRWGCVLCRLLDWIEPGHCANSPQAMENKI